MMKKKFCTTPLIPPQERTPLREMPAKPPSKLRVFWIFWKLAGLLSRSLRARLGRKLSPRQKALELRLFFEQMGGIWIKLGQVLGMRSDLFTMEFCNEISQMQDRAFAFPSALSRQIIERNLGCPIQQVFERLETNPFAAASLCQVHKGRLRRNGQWVAVKVQRPHAPECFRYDFFCLRLLASALRAIGLMPHMHWQEMLREVDAMMQEELDYRHEAGNLRKLRKTLKHHGVITPRVYLEFNTKQLLVMELLEGVFMSDFINTSRTHPARLAAWLQENDLDPAKIARRLLHSMLRQLYEDLLFHGDLHPGNILLLRKNRLAFIDFGNCGAFDADFAAKYDQYSRALAAGALAKAADLYLILMGKLPLLDLSEIKPKLIKIFQKQSNRSSIRNLPFPQRSISRNSGELNALAMNYRIQINWNALRMARSLGAMDQNIGILNPQIDYFKEIARYHRQALKRKLSRPKPQTLEPLSELSGLLLPNLRSRALLFEGRPRTGSQLAAFALSLLSLSLWAAAALAAWTYLHQHHPTLTDPYHHDQNPLTRWIESLPALRPLWWYLGLASLALLNLRFGRLIAALRQRPPRLPGQTD
ncbi:MAG: putative protein kinase UbiB [Verrucomicrobia subdivision 3 bacterium]|nr:putative protein kinase UbiB [Limisphaerales bacterium]MCS1417881.1 putative protein kinase UbiB [Limisphaerales bacterium]